MVTRSSARAVSINQGVTRSWFGRIFVVILINAAATNAATNSEDTLEKERSAGDDDDDDSDDDDFQTSITYKYQGELNKERLAASECQGSLTKERSAAANCQDTLEKERSAASWCQSRLDNQTSDASKCQGELNKERSAASECQGSLTKAHSDLQKERSAASECQRNLTKESSAATNCQNMFKKERSAKFGCQSKLLDCQSQFKKIWVASVRLTLLAILSVAVITVAYFSCFFSWTDRMPQVKVVQRRADGQASAMTVEEVVAGEHIYEEFKDTRVDCRELVAESTAQAKKFIQKNPIFFFGLTGVGKSTLVKAFLKTFEPCERDVPIGHCGATTKGIQSYRAESTEWATPGCREQIICLDTEGWELNKQNNRLLQDALDKAKSNERMEFVALQHRLIFVLVIDVNSRRHMEDPRYLSLVKKVCKDGWHQAGKRKPVLLTVMSQCDLLAEELQADVQAYYWKHLLLASIEEYVEVHPPFFVSVKEDNCKNIDKLKDMALDAAKRQLQSQGMLQQVQKIMEREMRKSLAAFEAKGLEAQATLARRHVWATARMCGLRVENLEAQNGLTWAYAQKLINMQTGHCSKALDLSCQKDPHRDPHMDSLRRTLLDPATHFVPRDPKGGPTACVSIPGGSSYARDVELLKGMGIWVPTVFFGGTERQTQADHEFKQTCLQTNDGDVCWQCTWMSNIKLLVDVHGVGKLVAIAGGGPGCEWERRFLIEAYLDRYKLLKLTINDEPDASEGKAAEDDGEKPDSKEESKDEEEKKEDKEEKEEDEEKEDKEKKEEKGENGEKEKSQDEEDGSEQQHETKAAESQEATTSCHSQT